MLKKLQDAGYESYIVGGCVRDSILGKIPNDWDICTSATPSQMEHVFTDNITVPTGLKHGTITVFMSNEGYEITTFRLDGAYSDGRRPDKVKFTKDIIEDLSRRDFTINAMAYSDKTGLVDPFNGMQDLIINTCIRCVGDPRERFAEDGLRILRAMRFSTQLGFTILPHTRDAIKSNKHLLSSVSMERIRSEFNKMLLSDKPSFGIEELYFLGLLDYIVPELTDCYGFNQKNPNHDKDVFYHTMEVMDKVEAKLELRLAALFHDIGKPSTFTVGEDGVGHFYGHHKESAKICREAMARLKYSNKEIEYVSELVYHHMTRYEKLKTSSVKKFINKVGVESLDDLFKLFIADRIGSSSPCEFDDIYRLKFECERVLLEKQPLSTKDLTIDGNDLMDIGIPQGREIGVVLRQLLEHVLEDSKLNDKVTLIEMAQTLTCSQHKLD